MSYTGNAGSPGTDRVPGDPRRQGEIMDAIIMTVLFILPPPLDAKSFFTHVNTLYLSDR